MPFGVWDMLPQRNNWAWQRNGGINGLQWLL
jgi:hypothetical protein